MCGANGIMDSKKIPLVCAAPLHFLPEIQKELENRFDVSYAFNESTEELKKKLPPAKAFIVNPGAPYRIDRTLLQKAPLLEMIITPSTGQDHIDVVYCAKKGIQVRSLRGREDVIENIHASAEFSFTLLLSMIKNLPKAAGYALEGRWREVEDDLRGVEIHGKNAGLIGYGRIGKKMSRYLHAMGAKIMAYDPNVKIQDEWVLQAKSMEEVLAWADIASVHVHLDSQTRGLFNKKTFSLMKPGGYFLNTSRGGVVIEQDLIDALESEHLKAAAVDVIEGEQSDSIGSNKLIQYAREHKNLTVTPHIAGLTVESQRKAAQFALKELETFFFSAKKAGI